MLTPSAQTHMDLTLIKHKMIPAISICSVHIKYVANALGHKICIRSTPMNEWQSASKEYEVVTPLMHHAIFCETESYSFCCQAFLRTDAQFRRLSLCWEEYKKMLSWGCREIQFTVYRYNQTHFILAILIICGIWAL